MIGAVTTSSAIVGLLSPQLDQAQAVLHEQLQLGPGPQATGRCSWASSSRAAHSRSSGSRNQSSPTSSRPAADCDGRHAGRRLAATPRIDRRHRGPDRRPPACRPREPEGAVATAWRVTVPVALAGDRLACRSELTTHPGTGAPLVSRDIDQLVQQLTLDEKASLTAGADLWSTVAVERLGMPVGVRHRRTERRPRSDPARSRRRGHHDRGVRAVRRRARRHVGRRAGRAGRRAAGRRGPHEGVPGPAGADGEPPPFAAGWPQLRVLLRGPAADRSARRRLRARGPVARAWPRPSSTSPATNARSSG